MEKFKVNPLIIILVSAFALLTVGCAEQEETTDTAAAPEAAPEAASEPPEFTIANVSGNLYVARTASHSTVFLVTPDGVIMADPLRADFAEWLKGELLSRFNATVKYVLYSHHHPDHAAGGNTFADTATFVGHEQMGVVLDGGLLPSNAVGQDADGNGTVERSEAVGGYANNFDNTDTNQDGSISGAEIHANTHPLDIVYNDHMTVTLGGSTVELFHSTPTHSEDMTVLLFPEERAAFGVDFVHVLRLPGNLSGAPVADYLQALAEVDALDFDILIQGHGGPGSKADLVSFIGFLQDLESEVAAAIAAGQSVEEAQESVLLSDYSDWLLYEQRRANLVGEMYGILSGG